MKKFLIPVALAAVVVIAGVFAFMPVEKAATVHGTLATTASQTTNTNTITTNTDDEMDAQDRFLYFEKNYTLTEVNSVQSRTIVRVDSGTTNGIVVITAERNSINSGGGGSLECGAGKGADGDDLSSGGNATSASATSLTAITNGTFSITDGSDILFGPDSDTSTIGGVCSIFIQFDNNDN